jgi:hypothetical protein
VSTTETIGGCIRFYNAGPEWHINTAHSTVGFKTSEQPVIEPDGDLTVTINGPTKPVVALMAVPDETLTTKGITAGGSGGVGHVTIRFFHHGLGRQLNLADPADYKLIRGEYSNLWLAVVRLVERPTEGE